MSRCTQYKNTYRYLDNSDKPPCAVLAQQPIGQQQSEEEDDQNRHRRRERQRTQPEQLVGGKAHRKHGKDAKGHEKPRMQEFLVAVTCDLDEQSVSSIQILTLR